MLIQGTFRQPSPARPAGQCMKRNAHRVRSHRAEARNEQKHRLTGGMLRKQLASPANANSSAGRPEATMSSNHSRAPLMLPLSVQGRVAVQLAGRQHMRTAAVGTREALPHKDLHAGTTPPTQSSPPAKECSSAKRMLCVMGRPAASISFLSSIALPSWPARPHALMALL